MSGFRPVWQLETFVVVTVLSIGSVLVSEAAAVRPRVPVPMHMDINSRRASIYDGYSTYMLGYRASESNTFTVTKNRSDINLDDVTANYCLPTYDGETQKYLECTVYGLREGTHYPVVRPETVEREKAAGNLYECLGRCYVVKFCYGDAGSSMYFSVFPEKDTNAYRNVLLGKWKKETRGWKYEYQDEVLTNQALINREQYYFGADGYMKTGQRDYKGDVYHLSPDSGAMRAGCIVGGFRLDSSGKRVDWKHEKSCTRQV